MNSKRLNVLCDIDHTLSNSFWRDEMIGGPGGWDEYHANAAADEPLPDMVNMINSLSDTGYNIVAITARPEKWRKMTMDWLVRYGIFTDELLMRADTDYHPAPEIKLKLANERFKDIKDEVAFVLDDRVDVVAAFKALGVTALQVHGRRV